MSLGMLLLYSILDVAFFAKIPSSVAILQINIVTAAAIIAFAMWYDQTGNTYAHALRSFYILPVGYMLYSQSHNYIRLINPGTFDATLAAWDLAIFKVDPVLWVDRYASPLLTEYLQIWYSIFQMMLVALAIDFYLARRSREFRIVTSTFLLGFCVSYILYVFMPAIGPRFAGTRFDSIDRDLPGVFLTHGLRAFINAGNNIAPGLRYPYAGVNPDCMPSGHTMMSVIAILLGWQYRSRLRWLVTIGGLSVIASTVYLRYHYVVDVIAGAALGILLFAVHRWVLRLWERAGVEV
jgi:membrane-associated phospholipid phosphatase